MEPQVSTVKDMSYGQNLFFLIAMIASLAILAASAVSLRKRLRSRLSSDAGSAFRVFTLFVLLATAVMFLPVYYVSFEFGDSRAFVRPALLSVHNAMRVFILDGEFNFIVESTEGMHKVLHVLFCFYAASLYVFAPTVFTFTIFLSIFRDAFARIRFFIHRNSPLYIFSNLNEESAAMARSIPTRKPEEHCRNMIVFCDVPRDDEKRQELSDLLSDRSDKRAYILLTEKAIDELKTSRFKKGITFFLMDSEEARNIRDASTLSERLNKQAARKEKPNRDRQKEQADGKPTVRILVYASSAASVPLVDAISRDRAMPEEGIICGLETAIKKSLAKGRDDKKTKAEIRKVLRHFGIPVENAGDLDEVVNKEHSTNDAQQKIINAAARNLVVPAKTAKALESGIDSACREYIKATLTKRILGTVSDQTLSKSIAEQLTKVIGTECSGDGSVNEISLAFIRGMTLSESISGKLKEEINTVCGEGCSVENIKSTARSAVKGLTLSDSTATKLKEIVDTVCSRDAIIDAVKGNVLDSIINSELSDDVTKELKAGIKKACSESASVEDVKSAVHSAIQKLTLSEHAANAINAIIDDACSESAIFADAKKAIFNGIQYLENIVNIDGKIPAKKFKDAIIHNMDVAKISDKTASRLKEIIDRAYWDGVKKKIEANCPELKNTIDTAFDNIGRIEPAGIFEGIKHSAKELPFSAPFSIMRIDTKTQLAVKIIRDFLNEKEELFIEKPENSLTVTMLGLGGIGKEILENLLWMGQFYKRKLFVNVFDETGPKLGRNPDFVHNPLYDRLACEWPELIKTNSEWQDGKVDHPDTEADYDVRFFFDTDCFSNRFRRMFEVGAEWSERLLASDLIICSLGDDDKNLEAAIMMRQLLTCMKSPKDADIYAVVYDDLRSDRVSGQSKLTNYKGVSYNVKTVGSMRDQFSFEEIRKLEEDEKEAVVHHISWICTCTEAEASSYWSKMDTKKRIDTLNEQLNNYIHYEYYRRSSLAKAIHKGILKKHGVEGEASSDHNRSNPNCRCDLCRSRITEHMRWNAYMRVNGYRYGAERDDMAKIHKDLKAWRELPESERIKD